MNHRINLAVGSDGAAAAVVRRRVRVYHRWSFLFRSQGRITEVEVVIATRKRWERDVSAGRRGDPRAWLVTDFSLLPLIVAVSILD